MVLRLASGAGEACCAGDCCCEGGCWGWCCGVPLAAAAFVGGEGILAAGRPHAFGSSGSMPGGGGSLAVGGGGLPFSYGCACGGGGVESRMNVLRDNGIFIGPGLAAAAAAVALDMSPRASAIGRVARQNKDVRLFRRGHLYTHLFIGRAHGAHALAGDAHDARPLGADWPLGAALPPLRAPRR